MDKIILAKALKSFGNALSKMKNVIKEIEDDMMKQSTDLKNERLGQNRDAQFISFESVSRIFLKHEIDERINQMKEEIKLLEKMKQLQFEIKNGTSSDSLSDLCALSSDQSVEEDTGYDSREKNQSEALPIRTKTQMSRSASDPSLYTIFSVENNRLDSSTGLEEWRQTDEEVEDYPKSTSSGVPDEEEDYRRNISPAIEDCRKKYEELRKSFLFEKLRRDEKEEDEEKVHEDLVEEVEIDWEKEQFERSRVLAFIEKMKNQESDSETESAWKPDPYVRQSAWSPSEFNEPNNKPFSRPRPEFNEPNNKPFSRPRSEFIDDPDSPPYSECSDFDAWWKLDQPDPYENGTIDWEEEEYERKRNRACLIVTTGRKNTLRTRLEIEQTLRKYTGPESPWTVDKHIYPKSAGACILTVRFKTCQDAKNILDLWGDRNQFDGLLDIDFALTKIEKEERKRMKVMSRRLRVKGYNVIYEDKRICVDGEWWKYCWGEGWARV